MTEGAEKKAVRGHEKLTKFTSEALLPGFCMGKNRLKI